MVFAGPGCFKGKYPESNCWRSSPTRDEHTKQASLKNNCSINNRPKNIQHKNAQDMLEAKLTYSLSPRLAANHKERYTTSPTIAWDEPIFLLDAPSDLIQGEVRKSPCRWLVTMCSCVIWVSTCIDAKGKRKALIEHGADQDYHW